MHLDDATQADRIDEYRALCLLGLNRTREAEEIVERLVARRPTSTYDVASYPPKFVTLHAEVKRRMLPIVAATLLTSGKISFEAGLYAQASQKFRELDLLLASAPDPAAFRDMKMLSEGFLKLSEERLAALVPPAAPTPPPSTAIAVKPSPPAAAAAPSTAAVQAKLKGVYGPEDLDVTPPEIINQRLPRWTPPNAALAGKVFRGSVEVIIGENGLVESGVISQPTFPTYDAELLRAARQWSYSPATRQGKPVKYRKLINVTLAP
jgi:hypothetical protein